MCPECGPRPDYLCMDGVCIRISVDNMRDQKDSDLFLAYSDKPILDAPEYKERMFLKQKKNRDLLKHSCLKNKYPDLRLVKFEKDPGMMVIKDVVQGVKSKGHSELPREYADVLLDISSFSSTISMLQIQNKILMNRLKENLDCEQSQLMCNQDSLELKHQLFKTYPLIYKRLENISRMVLADSLQRSVQSSVSYMKFENYLQAIRIFIGFYNLREGFQKINKKCHYICQILRAVMSPCVHPI